MRRIFGFFAIVCLALCPFGFPVNLHVAQAAPDSPDTIVLHHDWRFELNQAYASAYTYHGELKVASGCDVNGDGYEDVLVGRRDYDVYASGDDNGRAWLFYGGPAGLSTSPARVFNPPYTNYYGFFGTQVWCDLDVNGDGYDDILIGMDNYDSAYSDEGAVYLWHGSPTGPAAGYDWMARGNATYAHFGFALDSAGDVNGDGYDDIIVGRPLPSIGGASYAHVWFGSASGMGATGTPANADWSATMATGSVDGFGFTVRGIGDVNGNGHDDVMVSARYYPSGGNEGAVYVWDGALITAGTPGTLANAAWSAFGGQAQARFGWAADGVGDLNGDNFDDIAIGAHLYDTSGSTNDGAVFVWYGSAPGLGPAGSPANADWSAGAGASSSELGYSLRTGGDVNGDGYADLLAGARGYPVGAATGAGAWFVWLGAPGGLGDAGTPANADFAGYGNQLNGNLGRDDVAAGDVNGDGHADVFAAACTYDLGQTDEGVVFGYYYSLEQFLPLILR